MTVNEARHWGNHTSHNTHENKQKTKVSFAVVKKPESNAFEF